MSLLPCLALFHVQGLTFMGAGEQPEVLGLFLEILLPDSLDLNQMEDSCGKTQHELLDGVMLTTHPATSLCAPNLMRHQNNVD